MEFSDKHLAAIAPTVRVKNEVSAQIFDDKVRSMGTVMVNNGEIKISLDYLPGMINGNATRDFLIDSIALGIKACWDARDEAFRKSE